MSLHYLVSCFLTHGIELNITFVLTNTFIQPAVGLATRRCFALSDDYAVTVTDRNSDVNV